MVKLKRTVITLSNYSIVKQLMRLAYQDENLFRRHLERFIIMSQIIYYKLMLILNKRKLLKSVLKTRHVKMSYTKIQVVIFSTINHDLRKCFMLKFLDKI